MVLVSQLRLAFQFFLHISGLLRSHLCTSSFISSVESRKRCDVFELSVKTSVVLHIYSNAIQSIFLGMPPKKKVQNVLMRVVEIPKR